MIRWHRSDIFSHMREQLEKFFAMCGIQSPRIHAAIDGELGRFWSFPTASVSGDSRNCNFPGCIVSSELLSGLVGASQWRTADASISWPTGSSTRRNVRKSGKRPEAYMQFLYK